MFVCGFKTGHSTEGDSRQHCYRCQSSSGKRGSGKQGQTEEIIAGYINANENARERDAVQMLINIATYVLIYSEIEACR